MGKTPKRTDLTCAALLAGMVLVLFHRVILSRGLIWGQDVIQQVYPQACFTRDCLRSGQLPIWTPHMMCGAPMFSSAPFHPIDIALRWVDPRVVVNWTFVVCSILACVSTYALMRRWKTSRYAAIVAGITFGFSGFFLPKVFAGHSAGFLSSACIPLLFLLLDRTIDSRKVWLAALTGGIFGLQILGQHPQYVFYGLIAAMAFAIYKLIPILRRERSLKAAGSYFALFVLIGVLACGISAVYALPFAQLTSLSTRGGGAGYAFSSSLSLPPLNLMTAIAPNFWGSPGSSNAVWGSTYWDANVYVGIVPLALAIIGFVWGRQGKSGFFRGLLIASLLLALGSHTPFYKLLYHVPGFSVMRVPAKALVLYAFAMAVLAGFGYDTAATLDARKARKLRIVLTACACLLAVSLVAYLAAKPWILKTAHDMIHSTRGGSTKALGKLPGLYLLQLEALGLATLLTLASIPLLRRLRGYGDNRRAAIGLVVLTFLDLAIFGYPLINTVDLRDRYGANSSEVAFLEKQEGFFRVLPLENEVFGYSQGMLTGIQNVNGYYPLILRRTANYTAAANHLQTPKVCVTSDIRNAESPLLDLMNVRYILSRKPLCASCFKLVHRSSCYIYERNTLPRAFLVHQSEVAADDESALNRIQSKGFIPGETIVLQNPQPVSLASFGGMREDATITHYTPTRIEVSVNAVAPGYLFLSETSFPGWRATVDLNEEPILQANYLFRAVYASLFPPKSLAKLGSSP